MTHGELLNVQYPRDGYRDLAHIQQCLLPHARPNLDGYAFFDFRRPAQLVCGDYYDYLTRPDGRLAVIVADCTGMLPRVVVTFGFIAGAAKFWLRSESSPAAAMRILNECLCSCGCGDFVTMLAVVLDPETHELSIVNAGHVSPIWRRANGTAEDLEIDRPGLPLGVVGEIEYEEQTIQFLPGDMLILYTDGLFEALDPQGRPFSIDRLRSCIDAADMDVSTTGQAIVSNVVQHIGSRPQDDDICLVCLQRLPVGALRP
jgi:serine phosphatase RsbU (regulator of sigma subunit)